MFVGNNSIGVKEFYVLVLAVYIFNLIVFASCFSGAQSLSFKLFEFRRLEVPTFLPVELQTRAFLGV